MLSLQVFFVSVITVLNQNPLKIAKVSKTWKTALMPLMHVFKHLSSMIMDLTRERHLNLDVWINLIVTGTRKEPLELVRI